MYRFLWEDPALTRTAAWDETAPRRRRAGTSEYACGLGLLGFVALEPVLDGNWQRRRIADGAAVPPRDPEVGRFAVFGTTHRSAV